MSEKDKTIGFSDGWAMYEAVKDYNQHKISIEQLDIIHLASTGVGIPSFLKIRLEQTKKEAMQFRGLYVEIQKHQENEKI